MENTPSEKSLTDVANRSSSSAIEKTASTTVPHRSPSSSPLQTTFEIIVSKETFKFNAAHFVAFQGFRERLHGHNYRVGVRLLGSRKIGSDGYLLDFGCVKDAARKICKQLDERFLCPMYSDVLEIIEDEKEQQISIKCEDGSRFSFPSDDVLRLPVVHVTSEELAIYLWGEVLKLLNSSILLNRGIHTMEINVAEAVGQEAVFRWPIPTTDDDNPNFSLDVRAFVAEGKVVPVPSIADEAKMTSLSSPLPCGPDGQDSKEAFSKHLDRLALAINTRGLTLSNGKITRQDLEALLD